VTAKRTFPFLRWALIVMGLALLYPLTFIVLEAAYGGPHLISAGESHGFKVGMTKQEVLDKYTALEQSVNLRTISTNGHSGFLALERSELVLTPELEGSDHWMAYRSDYPVYFQEFFFSHGLLTNILNYIRFYETP
jgi:hypothetical protein